MMAIRSLTGVTSAASIIGRQYFYSNILRKRTSDDFPATRERPSCLRIFVIVGKRKLNLGYFENANADSAKNKAEKAALAHISTVEEV